MRYLDLYDLFVFDLDGTLADTREDLAASLNEALRRLGREPLDLETVTRYVGNGAPVLVRLAVGPEAPEETARQGLQLFLEDYARRCVESTRLYPGMEEVLAALAASGKRMSVLTNKPRGMSVKILEHLGVARRFARIDGGDTFPKKPDPTGLRAAMESLGAAPGRTVLVGDTAVDTATASAAGAAAAGALWGFKPDELLATPPRHLLRAPLDLLGIAEPPS